MIRMLWIALWIIYVILFALYVRDHIACLLYTSDAADE